MRVKMPKVPPIHAPPDTSFELEAISAPQVTTSQLFNAPPPTNQPKEIMIPATSAPLEVFHQVRPRTTKRARECSKYSKYVGLENDDSSGESTKSWPPNPTQPRRRRRAVDVESVQPRVVQNHS